MAPADTQAQSHRHEPLFRVRLWTRINRDCKCKIIGPRFLTSAPRGDGTPALAGVAFTGRINHTPLASAEGGQAKRANPTQRAVNASKLNSASPSCLPASASCE